MPAGGESRERMKYPPIEALDPASGTLCGGKLCVRSRRRVKVRGPFQKVFELLLQPTHGEGRLGLVDDTVSSSSLSGLYFIDSVEGGGGGVGKAILRFFFPCRSKGNRAECR